MDKPDLPSSTTIVTDREERAREHKDFTFYSVPPELRGLLTQSSASRETQEQARFSRPIRLLDIGASRSPLSHWTCDSVSRLSTTVVMRKGTPLALELT